MKLTWHCIHCDETVEAEAPKGSVLRSGGPTVVSCPTCREPTFFYARSTLEETIAKEREQLLASLLAALETIKNAPRI